MRPITSAATAVCGLAAVSACSAVPAGRSTSRSASVVVPISTATPYWPGIGLCGKGWQLALQLDIQEIFRIRDDTVASPRQPRWQARRNQR